MNYYEIVVQAARVVGKVNATKKEIVIIVERFFKIAGKKVDESKLSKAYKQFSKASGSKGFRPIYA